jgi:hypothetical protein
MNTEYTKNILPPNSPIVKYSGEWMSRSDFMSLDGIVGDLKKRYCVLFSNNTLDKKRDSPNTYAINYVVFQNCELIQTMNKISHNPLGNPSLAEIINLSKLWKKDIAWGFIADCDLKDTYFIGEVNDFTKLTRRLIQVKTGKLKSLA